MVAVPAMSADALAVPAFSRSTGTPPNVRQPPLSRDPRTWQVLSLATLLTWGTIWLGFDQPLHKIALAVTAALLTEALLAPLVASRPFEPRSALISSLSLCLLLRTSEPWLMALAGALAIASKYLIRFDGKHVFNPTNLAITLLVALSGEAWISPAQWGSQTWSAFLFACLAVTVLSRSRRIDIALAFLATVAALLFARALYLGDPMAIPLKQMQSGALLLFAFFMISDPKTTPDRRSARILYGAFVACLGVTLQLGCYVPEGMMYALFLASPLVPLIDRRMPIPKEDRFQWSRPTS